MFSNKVKAVGLFVVVLYALYGGELVNVSRDPRRGSGGTYMRGGGLLASPRAEYRFLPGTAETSGHFGAGGGGSFSSD